MKLIIIEGTDRVGKDTLIRGLQKELEITSCSIRHFDKPPKGLTGERAARYQRKIILEEFEFLPIHYNFGRDIQDEHVVIWNRSHLGEIVYSTLFRSDGSKPFPFLPWHHDEIFDIEYEFFYKDQREYTGKEWEIVPYLIYLYGDANILAQFDDGLSLTRDDMDIKTTKEEEHQLFVSALERTSIPNVKEICVTSADSYRKQEDIINEAAKFIRGDAGTTTSPINI